MTRGIIATPHYLASDAGAEVLREGGNAVDAAITANAVLCAVYPQMTSVGGDLFALVWPQGASEPVGLAGAGRSGSLASWQEVRSRGDQEMPRRGALTVTVPGTVGAWGRLLERYGSFGLGRVLGPAAALARDGYPVTENLATALAENADWLSEEPEAWRLLPPLKAGMTLRNPELAATLDQIGRTGILSFYRGEIGASIVESVRQRGGFLTEADLAAYRPDWVEPVSARYRDLTIFNLPPPTQGLAALGMMTRLGACEPYHLEPGLEFAERFVGVRDAVYPLRDRYITDPDFAEVPSRPFLDLGARAEPTRPAQPATPDGDTVYLCASDEHGNVVSLIQSVANAFGSGVVAGGTGVVLHNRGLYFSLDEAHVNRLEPRKRTMHTLIAALASRQGRPWAAFGSMGADGQPQIQAQLLINLADRGLDAQQAVAAPRLRVAPGGAELWIEADYPEAAAIARSRLSVKLMPPLHHSFGHAQALILAGAGWGAGADPRADGSVVQVS